MIPARIRNFSVDTISKVGGWSRTTMWRRGYTDGRLGVDVLRYMQGERAAAGLPPLEPDVQEEILTALATIEDARNAKAAETVAA